MLSEALVGLLDELPVETSLADSRFVAGDQQDGLALGVEGERDPPDAAGGSEAQLLTC